jgi:hypothetical protein
VVLNLGLMKLVNRIDGVWFLSNWIVTFLPVSWGLNVSDIIVVIIGNVVV